MKKGKIIFLLAAEMFACTWLFPQIAYRDCVHPVMEKESVQEESRLEEDDYVSLFDPAKSRFRIAWKWSMRN